MSSKKRAKRFIFLPHGIAASPYSSRHFESDTRSFFGGAKAGFFFFTTESPVEIIKLKRTIHISNRIGRGRRGDDDERRLVERHNPEMGKSARFCHRGRVVANVNISQQFYTKLNMY